MNDFDLGQLRALSATVSEGTLEAAAGVLHVTPSAVSQRLKALESAAGRVLLVRTKPVHLTPSGEIVLRLARQMEVIVADATAELEGEQRSGGRIVVPLAFNADSVATWALPALAALGDEFAFDLRREDQQNTTALLRDGTVMAAVTVDSQPVPGCTSIRLGSMRYRPMASPAYARRWFPGGISPVILAKAPVVAFDRDDDLQRTYLRRKTRSRAEPPVHYVPSSVDFINAVALGLGWGMLPELQVRSLDAGSQLIDLDPDGSIDVRLYWQQWLLRSPSLDRVATAVVDAAREQLLQEPSGRSRVPRSRESQRHGADGGKG